MQEKNQKIQKTPKNEKTTRRLLKEFYTDKKYLESLLKDKSTATSFTMSSFFIPFSIYFTLNIVL